MSLRRFAFFAALLFSISAQATTPFHGAGGTPVGTDLFASCLASTAAHTWVDLSTCPGASAHNTLASVGYSGPNVGGGIAGIMGAWGGATMDMNPAHPRMFVLGGGHVDYDGNEIYKFDLKTLAWSEITQPDQNWPFNYWLNSGGSNVNVVSAANNGSGLIRVEFGAGGSCVNYPACMSSPGGANGFPPTNGLNTGMQIVVKSTSVFDGTWTVTVVDGNHADLQGSTFSATATGTATLTQAELGRFWASGSPTNPIPVHSYDDLAYNATLNVIEHFQFYTGHMFLLNPDTQNPAALGNWVAYDDFPNNLFVWGIAEFQAISKYDPTSHLTWIAQQAGAGLFSFDPTQASGSQWAAHLWNGSSTPAFPCVQAVSSIQPGGKMFFTGGESCSAPKTGYFTLTGTIPMTRQTTTGDQTVENLNVGGAFSWDATLSENIAWNGGTGVIFLDPTTWVWTDQSESGATPTCTGSSCSSSTGPQTAGTYGRFQCLQPIYNACIVVNGVNDHVFALNQP